MSWETFELQLTRRFLYVIIVQNPRCVAQYDIRKFATVLQVGIERVHLKKECFYGGISQLAFLNYKSRIKKV